MFLVGNCSLGYSSLRVVYIFCLDSSSVYIVYIFNMKTSLQNTGYLQVL